MFNLGLTLNFYADPTTFVFIFNLQKTIQNQRRIMTKESSNPLNSSKVKSNCRYSYVGSLLY